MKKLLIFAGIAAMLSAYSCSNDFDLIEEWQDIPVVYGLLSRADTAHYIRVEKAFVDPSQSALEIAQIPDSLYYENVSVQIEHLASQTVYNLERVNGADEGYPREEGVFATSPNYLYKFKLDDPDELVGGEEYRLTLNRGDNKPEVVATTRVIADLDIAVPSTTIKFEADRKTKFRWNSGEHALFFDLSLRLNYLENTEADPTEFVEKSLLWPLRKNIARDELQNIGEYEISDGNDFYRFIANSLADAPPRIRDFKNIDVIVTGGDKNLFDYINIGQANTGITSAQVVPSYTNLSEGYGIFGSTNRNVRTDITLTTATEDSLRAGQFTEFLNFQ